MNTWFFAFNNNFCGEVAPEITALASSSPSTPIPSSQSLPNWAVNLGNTLGTPCSATMGPSPGPGGDWAGGDGIETPFEIHQEEAKEEKKEAKVGC